MVGGRQLDAFVRHTPRPYRDASRACLGVIYCGHQRISLASSPPPSPSLFPSHIRLLARMNHTRPSASASASVRRRRASCREGGLGLSKADHPVVRRPSPNPEFAVQNDLHKEDCETNGPTGRPESASAMRVDSGRAHASLNSSSPLRLGGGLHVSFAPERAAHQRRYCADDVAEQVSLLFRPRCGPPSASKKCSQPDWASDKSLEYEAGEGRLTRMASWCALGDEQSQIPSATTINHGRPGT